MTNFYNPLHLSISFLWTPTNFNTPIILLHPTPSLYFIFAQRPTSIPLFCSYTPLLFCTILLFHFCTPLLYCYTPSLSNMIRITLSNIKVKTPTHFHTTIILLHSFFVYRFCTTTNFNTTILQLLPPHSFFVYRFCTTTNFNTTFILLHPTPSFIFSAQWPTLIPLLYSYSHPTPSLVACNIKFFWLKDTQHTTGSISIICWSRRLRNSCKHLNNPTRSKVEPGFA